MSGRQEKALKYQYSVYALGNIRAHRHVVDFKTFKTYMSRPSFEDTLNLMVHVEHDLIHLVNTMSKEDRRWLIDNAHTLGKSRPEQDKLPGVPVTTRKL